MSVVVTIGIVFLTSFTKSGHRVNKKGEGVHDALGWVINLYSTQSFIQCVKLFAFIELANCIRNNICVINVHMTVHGKTDDFGSRFFGFGEVALLVAFCHCWL